ncbi:MAG: hypothetical protein ACKVPX_06025 [Myxococcaceae bacterium]
MQLSKAEEWQRAQAWETWDRYLLGEVRERSWEDVARLFDDALGRRASPLSRRRRSRTTSKRKFAG